MERLSDTIFALATAPGRAGVAIMRVSGPSAVDVLVTLTERPVPEPRLATVMRLLDVDGSLIDEALVLRFEGSRSFTGEDVVELQCHGSPAVIVALTDRIAKVPGCRHAEAGEFTKRALLNGRMELSRVEALGDLIMAETSLQHRQAIRGFSGDLENAAERWREALLTARALLEASIDWADEEIPEDVTSDALQKIESLLLELRSDVAGSVGRERLRDGFEIAVIGPPNCGKSSFINWLAKRDAVITSPIAGTTRDIIELSYDLDGLPVVFLDTAGLRETSDAIEQIGVGRTLERARRADLRLHFREAGGLQVFDDVTVEPGDFMVETKADVARGSGEHAISVKTGEGLPGLLEAVRAELSTRLPTSGVIKNARQRESVEGSIVALELARKHLLAAAPELAAEELRRGLVAFDELVGRIGVEDVLGRVFRNFCVGK